MGNFYPELLVTNEEYSLNNEVRKVIHNERTIKFVHCLRSIVVSQGCIG